MRSLALHCSLLLLIQIPLLWPSATARAVLIDAVDGGGNTTAPLPDPGFDRVGKRGGLTAIHLGDGWILTAHHVGMGDVDLGGTVYPHVPGSDQRLANPDASAADLLVFRIYPFPSAPLVPIVAMPPVLGTEVVLIGQGRNRGSATSWDPNGPPPPGPIGGYAWAPGRTLRWGRNHVEDYPPDPVLGTWSFATVFDEGVSEDEAQAVPGDSGGAAFTFDGSQWELVGVVYAIELYADQPAETSLYGQSTYVADLSVYRDEIEQIIALPEPAHGLICGLAALVALGRHRSGRARGWPPTSSVRVA